MDDVNDADQEDDLDSNNADDRTDREDWIEEKWSGQSKSLVQPSPWGQKNKLPRNLSLGKSVGIKLKKNRILMIWDKNLDFIIPSSLILLLNLS